MSAPTCCDRTTTRTPDLATTTPAGPGITSTALAGPVNVRPDPSAEAEAIQISTGRAYGNVSVPALSQHISALAEVTA